MPNLRRAGLVIVCLGITGRGVPRAEPAQVDWVEDPYAPHVTRGSTIRLGTAVGFLYDEPLDVLAIGGTLGLGRRFGRLAIDAELTVLSLQSLDSSNARLGDAERLGAMARYDVLRIGPRWVGPNSLIAVYVEGGAAVAWNHWSQPSSREPARAVPVDEHRVEGQGGLGIAIDHRLQEPIGFPHRIGWFLGWRIAGVPGSAAAAPCRDSASPCRTVSPQMPEAGDRITIRSMLFESSLVVTW